MTDLADFLLARIAEDEAGANEASEGLPNKAWDTDPAFTWALEGVDHRVVQDDVAHEIAFSHDGWADHIARHDPARVLAECEAKRRIVEQYRDSAKNAADYDDNEDHAITYALRLALLAVALPYADHPDYREEWRP